jgi:nucleoside-diphosphate-sugar epimerase
VLRLAGLYTRGRGAHTYFMRQPEVPGRPDGLLNLVHYVDAAAAAVAALRVNRAARGTVYIACDGAPVSREDMMRAALASGLFPEGAMPRFTGAPGAPLGRRMDCPVTRKALGWAPRYASFQAFMAAGAPE